MEWRRDFVRTYLERDIPSLGIGIPAATVRRFWTMLAHYHGQVWNASELGRAMAVSNVTVGRYLDLLSGTYVVRVLRPFFVNLKKRQVKAPKVYIADSGLLHALLGLETLRDLEGHPKVGASWEGFGIEQVIQRLGAHPDECHFWATHAGAELDLLVVRGNQRWGFEFKRTVAPRITSSMRIAMSDLGLTSIDVVHAGDETFPLGERIRALAMTRLIDDLRPL
jgi:predicted AAA+ superfamily ATPase